MPQKTWTLVLNDVVGNIRDAAGFGGWLLHMTRFAGREAQVPAIVKMAVIEDTKALRTQLMQWAEIESLVRIWCRMDRRLKTTRARCCVTWGHRWNEHHGRPASGRQLSLQPEPRAGAIVHSQGEHMNPSATPLSNAAPVDEDLAEQARPGFGIPSQDPRPEAQVQLEPEEAEREAKSVLMGGGVVAGAAAGATIGVVVAGPVGVLVGGTLGAVAGALGGAAAGAALKPEDSSSAGTAPSDTCACTPNSAAAAADRCC